MKNKKWYKVKLLFMEKKDSKVFGMRFYILLKENSLKQAEKKALRMGKEMSYPYEKDSNVKFEFIGIENILQCYSSPKDGAMLSVLKDEGSQWIDALSYVKPHSKHEIETFRYSPKNLYLASLVYFVKNNKKTDIGKVTNCQMLVRSSSKERLLPKIYQIAVNKKTFKDVTKIRRDCTRDAIVEFVGIEDVVPVFDTIKNGMELNQTVELFKSKNDLVAMIKWKGSGYSGGTRQFD